MSQIEQIFSQFISKRPEIEKCYVEGLINRRALARYLIEKKAMKEDQFDALIAMLRRYEFKKYGSSDYSVFKGVTTQLKDNLAILNYEKSEETLRSLNKIIGKVEYGRGETLKIVVGTSNITLILDEKKSGSFLKDINEKPKNSIRKVSEISLIFPEEAVDTKGVISLLSRELCIHGILISEILTASRELLLYLKEEYVISSYEVIKSIQRNI